MNKRGADSHANNLERIMELMKVFDWTDMPREGPGDTVLLLGGELHNLGNDAYYPWRTGRDKYDDQWPTGGYVSQDDYAAVVNWLLENGAEPDEEVLIWVSW
jgi:hypothetical protein